MNKKWASIYISATVLSGMISVPRASTVIKRYPRLDFENLIYNMGELRFSDEKSYTIKKTMLDNDEDTSTNESNNEDSTQDNTDESSQDNTKDSLQDENKESLQDTNEEVVKEEKNTSRMMVNEEPSTNEEEVVDEVSDEEVNKANVEKEKAKKEYKDLERFNKEDKEITVPRINKEVNKDEIVDVPQGLAMDDKYVYISSYDGVKGYLSDLGKSTEQIQVHNSVIYVLRLNDKSRRYKTIILPDHNHVGGLTYTSGRLWITSGQRLVYLDTNKIDENLDWNNADPYIVTNYDGENKLNGVMSASFVTSYNDDLYVGTFNETSNSIIRGFHMDSEVPFVSYSVIKKAQGATFMNIDNITYLIVSSSYGRKNSSGLYTYMVSNVGTSSSKITSHSSIVLPGMSEGIVEKDGVVYLLFESASPRYNANPSNSASSPIGKIIAGSSTEMIKKYELNEKDIHVDVDKTTFTFNGKLHQPHISNVKYKNMNLPYHVQYTSSKLPGSYKVVITINTPTYHGVKTIYYKINKADSNSSANVSLSRTSYTYNKKVHKPSVKSVTVYGHKIKVKSVVYLTPKSKNVGIYTIKIILKDNPYASTTLYRTYKIVPKATKIKSAKAGKGTIKLKWTKQSARYEIQYSTNKGMKSSKIKRVKSTSTTLKKLSRKKYYYIRIRTYKIVNGKYIYSSYSSIKKVRVK